MGLDDSSATNGFGVAKLCSSSPEILVYCADFCRRLDNEFVFGVPVSSRYRLSLLLLVTGGFNGEGASFVHVRLYVPRNPLLILHGIFRVGHDGL